MSPLPRKRSRFKRIMDHFHRKIDKEPFVGHNFDHLNLLQPRPYGKQYESMMKCIAMLNAGKDVVYLHPSWVLISKRMYDGFTRGRSKMPRVHYVENEFADFEKSDELVNISTFIEDPDVSLEDIEKMSFRTTGRTNLMTRLVHKFFYNQKKEGKMKVNVEIAKICHEANHQYCIDNQLKTHAKWDELPDEMQESVIAGVAKIVDDPKITAEEMHDNWINYKAEQGWLYGDELDIAEKLHPNMVIWKKLSKVERGKDKLFLSIVKREMKA